MPYVIPFIFAALGQAGVYGVLTEAILVIASSIAVAVYEKQQAEEEARAAYLNSLTDRIIQIRSGVSTRGYVLGTVRLGGTLIYINPVGTKGEALDQVVVFANNQCQIQDWIVGDDIMDTAQFPGPKYGFLKFDPAQQSFTVTGPTATVVCDEPVRLNTVHVTWRQGGSTGTATGTVTAPQTVSITGLPAGTSDVVVSFQTQQAEKLRGQFYPGTASQTPIEWDGYPNADWDSSHQLNGAAYGRVLYIWDQNVWQAGAPQFTAVLTGQTCAGYPFYDPRDGSHPAATKNPALLAAWWMTFPRSMGGCGIPSDWIDYTTVAAAANICDELVTVRTVDGNDFEQIPRYECDTYLDTAVDPLTNLETILSAMAGYKYFTAGGQYKMFAGAFRPAILTLTDSDIVLATQSGAKPLTLNPAAIEDEPANIATGTFVDATQQWLQSSPVVVTNDTYVTEDGFENPLDVKLLATTDPRRARYLMGIALEEARPALGVSCSIAGIGESLSLGDTVQLNLVNRPQYAGRTLEIVEMTDNWDGTFDVSLAELKTTTFALDPTSYTPVTPVAPVDNSYLWNPPAPTGFEIVSTSPTTLPDGTAVSRVVLAWDPIPDPGNTPGARFELRYRLTGGDFIDGGSVPGDSTGTVLSTALLDGEVYQFEIRFVNGIGAASDWSDAYTGIAGVALPTPQSLRLSASAQIFRVPQTGNALPLLITLTAIRTGGLTAAAVWTSSPSINLGGSGDTRTVAYAGMGSNDAVEITLTVIQSGVTYVDKVTIVKVYDGASSTTDPTAPPTPTGLAVDSFLVDLLVRWDTPTFTMGHGYDATVVYAAQVITGQSAPNFSTAKPVGSSNATQFVFPAAPGTTWAFWIKWQTRDGVLSTSPAGGTNGIQQTTAQIGSINLADGLITAQKLADGSITAAKLIDGAITATKLASNLQAVTIVSGALPSTNVGNVVYHTDDNKLYRWNGSTYTVQVQAPDIAGQLTDSQLASIAAAKLTGTITTTQIGPNTIQTANIAAGVITSAQIAADTITAGNIAANAIGVSELAAGSVVAGKIAANAVTAGTIAAAAVSAAQIAASAITTDKLLVTGKGSALNSDPGTVDQTAWLPAVGTLQLGVVDSTAPNGRVLRVIATSGSYGNFYSTPFPIVVGRRYRVTLQVKNASSGILYLRLWQTDSAGNNIAYDSGVEGVSYGGSWTRFTGFATAASGAVLAQLGIWANYPNGGGFSDFADIRCEEVIPGELIVDGAITATKLAANSIAVGTAAIQNGAIVNAMIASASIDSAKIIDASITTAKIVDLSVSTLKIADNAVTVPSSAVFAGPVVYSSFPVNFHALSINASGQPVMVMASAATAGGGSVTLFRDGTKLGVVSPSAGSSSDVLAPLCGVLDHPSAGPHTYTLQLDSVGSVLVYAAAIISLETKK